MRPSGRPRVSHLATYRSGTPQVQHPVIARWHAHLHGLATAIHETSGLTHWQVELTLMLHTYVEEKRARVHQMWLRTGSDRSRRT